MELGRGDRFFLFDTPPDPGFDRLTELVCLTLGVPVALISLVADDRQFFKSAAGLTGPWAAARETPIRYSICRHVVAEGAMLVVPDAAGDPRLTDNPAIVQQGIGAYLGVPIRTQAGRVIGALCAIDQRPRDWGPEARRTMQILGESVDAEIALREEGRERVRALLELTRANRRLQHQEVELRQARDRSDRMLAEQTAVLTRMSHELRTPLNGIFGGLACLRSLPGTRDGPVEGAGPGWLATMERSARALLAVVEQTLERADQAGADQPGPNQPGADCAASSGAVAPYMPLDQARAVIRRLGPAAMAKGVDLSLTFDIDLPELWTSRPVAVERILVTLVGNALRFTQRGGVTLAMARGPGGLVYRVDDSGDGIAPTIAGALLTPRCGEPVHAALARCTLLAAALGGHLTLERTAPGQGSTFRLDVPALDPA